MKHFIAAPPTDQADDIGINVTSAARKLRVWPRKVTAALSVVEMLVLDVTLLCQHPWSK
jgi:hypothetical protein